MIETETQTIATQLKYLLIVVGKSYALKTQGADVINQY